MTSVNSSLPSTKPLVRGTIAPVAKGSIREKNDFMCETGITDQTKHAESDAVPIFRTAGNGTSISISEESMAKAKDLFNDISGDGDATYRHKPFQRNDAATSRVAGMKNSKVMIPRNKTMG
eukprot:12677862-Ditylum_brightwellii.AAC.1